MSLIMDDKSTTSNSPGVYGTRKRSNSKNLGAINPDSPRTIEACMELGINPQDLRQKYYYNRYADFNSILRPAESFFDTNTPEDLVKLRYNHYLGRYNQTVKEVTAKRRELAKIRQYPASPKQFNTEQTQPGKGSHPGSNTNLNNGSRVLESKVNSRQNLMRNSLTLSKTEFYPATLLANFNKTVSYLRGSARSPAMKKPEELQLQVDEDTKEFDKQLFQEVEKFNTAKKMKQKEALRIYEDDLKRIKLISDINERAKRKEELEAKMRKEMKTSQREKQKRAEEKLSAIKDLERSLNNKRKQAEEQLRKKFEEKSLKLHEEKQERARSMQEHEQRFAEKKRKAEEARLRHEKLIETEIAILDQNIREKMYDSQEKHVQVMNDKIESIRAKMEKLSEKVNKMQEQRVQKEEEFLHELVDKVKEKERKNQVFEKKRKKENSERLARLKAKNDSFKGNAKKLKSEERNWLSNLEARQKRAEERVEQRKLEEQNQIRIKQELRRLKQQDNQENFERKHKMMEYEQMRILDKEREMAEKLQFMKTQKEIIQKARLESSIQVKLERDRIADVIMNLSKKVRLKDSDKEESSEDVPEEKKVEQPAQSQTQSPVEAEQVPKNKNGHLKKINQRGIKYLSKVVDIGDKELNEIDQILSGPEIFRTRRAGSLTPSVNSSAIHYK